MAFIGNATNSDSVDLNGITGIINNQGSIVHNKNTYTNNGTITNYTTGTIQNNNTCIWK